MTIPTEMELRRQYAGYDADGDLMYTIHVGTVHDLLKKQAAEISRLRESLDAATDVCGDQIKRDQADIERLQTENKWQKSEIEALRYELDKLKASTPELQAQAVEDFPLR